MPNHCPNCGHVHVGSKYLHCLRVNGPGTVCPCDYGAQDRYDEAIAALKAWKEYEEGPSNFSYDEVQTKVDAAIRKWEGE